MKTCTKDNELIRKVKENILKNNLLEKGDTVICALSGGADSVCLLHVLESLKDEIGFSLKAAHLNHGIRGEEAKRDEKFSEKLCKTLGVKCFIRHRDIPALSGGKNMELFGREERYKFFSELSAEYKSGKIAVAHNKNDVAETLVMRLIRGSSVFGLKGIPVKNKNIIRPLLSVSRSEIEAYLEENGIPFVTDSTNLSDDYTRNRIRHNILPEMALINEGYLNSVVNTANRMEKTADFISASAKENYGEITGTLDIEKVSKLHEVLKDYIITESAYKAGVKELSEKNITEISELFDSASGKKADLPGGFYAVKIYSSVKFLKKEATTDYSVELNVGKTYIEEAGYTILIEESEKGIDKEKISFPLYARPRKSGDFIEISGTNGKKKIKNLFIDEKLPLDKRNLYPLICSGEDIVFALGRCGKKYITDEKSKCAYTIKIIEGEC